MIYVQLLHFGLLCPTSNFELLPLAGPASVSALSCYSPQPRGTPAKCNKYLTTHEEEMLGQSHSLKFGRASISHKCGQTHSGGERDHGRGYRESYAFMYPGVGQGMGSQVCARRASAWRRLAGEFNGRPHGAGCRDGGERSALEILTEIPVV